MSARAPSPQGRMHVDGVKKNPSAFEHVDPAAVGNHRQILLSEVSGRSALIAKISEVVPGLTKDSPELETLVGELKELEFQGYQFEAATASFEMVVLKELGRFRPFLRPRAVPDHRRTGQRGPTHGLRDGQGAGGRPAMRSPPTKATARSTRSTARCARRSRSFTRTSRGSASSTTRCASWTPGRRPPRWCAS